MLTEIQDRDDIFSKAIAIASAEERAAFLARACGDDAALRRRMEEKVAAHFQAGGANHSPHAAATAHAHPNGHNTHANGHNREHGGTPHAEARPLAPRVTPHPTHAEHRRGSAMKGTLLLFLAAAVAVSIGLAVWAMRSDKQARLSVQQAEEERDQARKAVEAAKQQRDQAQAERKALEAERDQTLKVKEAAERSEQDAKDVLAFIQNNLLSAGHAMGWGGEQTKNMTLREAVDAAKVKLGEGLAERPLMEASIRETLGSTYLDLGDAKSAIKQYERALALREVLQGPDNLDTGDCRNKLAVAYRQAGRTVDAGRLYDLNPVSSANAATLAIRGALLLSQNKPVEAELKLRQCLTIRQKEQPDDWSTFAAEVLLGEALLAQKKYADAEPLLKSGYEGMKQREAKIPPQDKSQLAKALDRLVRLYEAWGKKDEAAKWRKESQTVETPRSNADAPGS